MEYQCGNCGVPLADGTLDSGICPNCGARISPFGDVIATRPQHMASHSELPAPPSAPAVVTDEPPSYADAHALATQARLQTIRSSRATGRLADPVGASSVRVPTVGLVVGIGIAAVMILLCSVVATGTLLSGFSTNSAPPPTKVALRITPGPTAPVGLGFPTQDPNPTSLPYLQNTPTFEPTSTPFGGPPTPSPTMTPTPAASATPGATTTPPPAGGVLAVSPPGQSTNCPEGHATFTVSNAGQGILNWSATSPTYNGNNIQPASGSLDPGGNVNVTIKHIGKSGAVTFTDTDNNSPPITVQILCN